jgi:hypothetical protein
MAPRDKEGALLDCRTHPVLDYVEPGVFRPPAAVLAAMMGPE